MLTCRVLVDSNVLFSAILSAQGVARRILLLSAQEVTGTIMSHEVAELVERSV